MLLPLVWFLVLSTTQLAHQSAALRNTTSHVPSRFRFNINKDEVFFDTRVIPEEHQVSAFLYKGETKLFFFLNNEREGGLVLAVTPCSSSLEWSVRFRPQNVTGILNETEHVGEEELQSFRGRQQHVFRTSTARLGLYVVVVRPLERETYVHFYASRSEPLHQSSPQLVRSKLQLVTQKQHRRLAIRWDPSSVDPHLMHYCLVLNPRRDYATFCAAQGDRYGVTPPEYPSRGGYDFPRDRQESHKSELASKAARQAAGSGGFLDMVVKCVGQRTHFSLGGLIHGKVYHINVFAINKRSNLSFPYASATVKYDGKPPKPTGLRGDGKPVIVKFKQLDGLASFKFKVGANVSEADFVVLPCGGAVMAEVLLGRQPVVERVRVDSFGRLRVPNPAPGRYVLRVTATDPEELGRVESLEVMATTRGYASTWSLPELPALTAVHEYSGLRTCDSITLGWPQSPDPLASRYCLRVRHQPRYKTLQPFYKKPVQCRRSPAGKHAEPGLVFSKCFQHEYNASRPVVTQRVVSLRPGRGYEVEVSVLRPGGRPLSYDLRQVFTSPTCEVRRRRDTP